MKNANDFSNPQTANPAFSAIKHLELCVENLKNITPQKEPRKINEFDLEIFGARNALDSAIARVEKAFALPQTLMQQIQNVSSKVRNLTRSMDIKFDNFTTTRIKDANGNFCKMWRRVLISSQSSVYGNLITDARIAQLRANLKPTNDLVADIECAIAEFLDFTRAHIANKELFLDRVDCKLRNLKAKISEVVAFESSADGNLGDSQKPLADIEALNNILIKISAEGELYGIFAAKYEIIYEAQKAIDALTKAIDIKFDNAVLSRRKDSRGYFMKERQCKCVIGGEVVYGRELIKPRKHREPINAICERVSRHINALRGTIKDLPKMC